MLTKKGKNINAIFLLSHVISFILLVSIFRPTLMKMQMQTLFYSYILDKKILNLTSNLKFYFNSQCYFFILFLNT